MRTYKSEFNIEWVPPPKLKCTDPSMTGDRSSLPEVDLSRAQKLSSSLITYRSKNLQVFKNWLKLIEYQSVKQNKVASVAHSVAVLKPLRQLLTFVFYSFR